MKRFGMLPAIRPADALAVIAVALCLGGPATAQSLDPNQLVGVWDGYEMVAGYSVGTKVIFFPQETYQKTGVLGDLMAWQTGNWAVTSNWIHLYPMDYGPTEYMGNRLSMPPQETWVVDYFDGSTLHAVVAGTNELTLQRTQ